MTTFWTVGIVLLLTLNAIFLVVVLAFARELGALLVRLGPAYAKAIPTGPAIGDTVEAFDIQDVFGLTHHIGPTKSESKLLVFVGPHCPACKALLPALSTIARDYEEQLRVYAISNGDTTPIDLQYAERLKPLVDYACDKRVHDAFAVEGTPYTVLLNGDNEVIEKGIANNLAQLESLFGVERYVEQPVKAILPRAAVFRQGR